VESNVHNYKMSYTQVIHTYIHTYIRTYIHKYINVFIRTQICMYIHKYICPYIHTYLHTFLHTNIPWIHKSVTRQQDVEQIIHMHKTMHKFLEHGTILQDIFTCHLYIIKNSSTEQNECVFRYPFSATSKFAYLFLRFVSLHGKLLIILIPEQNAPF